MEWNVQLTLSSGAIVQVSQFPFRIGRSPTCDFRLNRKQVGKLHCFLECVPAGQSTLLEEENEGFEHEVEGVELCLRQAGDGLITCLNRVSLETGMRALLLLEKEHQLVLGHEALTLYAEANVTRSRRGRYRNRKHPGTKAINRGGVRTREWADEFDDTLRARRN